MKKKVLSILFAVLLILLFSEISKSLTSTSTNYSICIGQQGATLSSNNYTLLLNLGSPRGNSSSLQYKLNLGFISECIESEVCCNSNSICEKGETQENCLEDCFTNIEIIPSKTIGGSDVNLNITFSDSRYKHEIGTKIKIKLLIDSSLNWGPSYNCFSNVAITLLSRENYQTCDWDYRKASIKCGTFTGNMSLKYFPSENKVELIGKCKIPIELAFGHHKINATISIYLIK